MYATDLALVARSAGLKVTEVRGWRTRGHGELNAVKGVVCHHTAGPASGVMPSLNVVTNGRKDLSGPLCNLALGRDGTVFVVAAGLAYHAGQVRQAIPPYSNAYMLGIEAENTGQGEPWPKVQLDAYALLCAALAHHYGFGTGRVLAHREVCWPAGRKIDPYGIDMGDFRRDVEADLARLAAPAPKPPVVGRPAPGGPGPVTKPLAAPPFPLRAGAYFGPRLPLWNVSSVSGYFSHSADLKVWQKRMQVRGWDLGVTGHYDARAERVARLFRAEKHLGPGARIDAATWRAAWEAPVTR